MEHHFKRPDFGVENVSLHFNIYTDWKMLCKDIAIYATLLKLQKSVDKLNIHYSVYLQ